MIGLGKAVALILILSFKRYCKGLSWSGEPLFFFEKNLLTKCQLYDKIRVNKKQREV